VTPYRLQAAALRRGIDAVKTSCEKLTIEINTVDAVQGREADFLIFSSVRSNADGVMGFVRDIARANVALSRGRFGLAIFGDANFFDRVQSPLQRVLTYVRGHPGACKLEILTA
jgi:superfamily I DNA and/or RNA helicase